MDAYLAVAGPCSGVWRLGSRDALLEEGMTRQGAFKMIKRRAPLGVGAWLPSRRPWPRSVHQRQGPPSPGAGPARTKRRKSLDRSASAEI